MDEGRDIIAQHFANHLPSDGPDFPPVDGDYAWADKLLAALAKAGLAVVPREPTEAMVDAPRPLILFYGPPKVNFTLGQHIDSGTRKVRLTDNERALNYVNKATLAHLIWRAMLEAADPTPHKDR